MSLNLTRIAELLALDRERTQGYWVEDDGHIHSADACEASHEYVSRLLSDPEFGVSEGPEQKNRPFTGVADCDQYFPNFEADAAFIAAAPELAEQLRLAVARIAAQSAERNAVIDQCIAILKDYTMHPDQIPASWHSCADCMEAMMKLKEPENAHFS